MPAASSNFLYRLWDQGQQHLSAGRYSAARCDLEAAEAIAWRHSDAQSLARLYLPLLEARRLIRYQAVEGLILICPPELSTTREHQLLTRFLHNQAGTILLASSSHGRRKAQHPAGTQSDICRFAGSVQYEARRTGHWLEALLMIQHGQEIRIASQADPTFAAGIPVRWTDSAADAVGDSTDPNLIVPLPRPGQYPLTGGPENANAQPAALHAVARESLLIAWEALALKWQRRHPPPHALATRPDAQVPHPAWNEMAWLRLALRVDPACEPVTMRLMALAEAIERS